jgi:hypothetical protein
LALLLLHDKVASEFDNAGEVGDHGQHGGASLQGGVLQHHQGPPFLHLRAGKITSPQGLMEGLHRAAAWALKRNQSALTGKSRHCWDAQNKIWQHMK